MRLRNPSAEEWGLMRLLLHDFGDYAFTRQLAAWLAQHGYEVLHVRAGDLGGPNTRAAEVSSSQSQSLSFSALHLGRPFNRYQLAARLRDELAYGDRLARLTRDWQPDIVLSANTPPLVQYRLSRAATRAGAYFVNWVQDIFGLAGSAMPGGWSLLLPLLRHIEFASMRRADALVLISPDFQDRLRIVGVRHDRVLIQENWAPVDLLAGPERQNAWSQAHDLNGRPVLLLAGTLGLKHNPGLIAALARQLGSTPEARVVVVSEGPGRAFLETARVQQGLSNLLLLDYQLASCVPSMLASADIAIVILNRGAGAASVPSKLYSYAAAGRPVLAAIPADNLAYRLIRQHGLGLVVEPEDEAGFLAAAHRLLTDTALRAQCAAAAAAFARTHCDIDQIGSRFDQLLRNLRPS